MNNNESLVDHIMRVALGAFIGSLAGNLIVMMFILWWHR